MLIMLEKNIWKLPEVRSVSNYDVKEGILRCSASHPLVYSYLLKHVPLDNEQNLLSGQAVPQSHECSQRTPPCHHPLYCGSIRLSLPQAGRLQTRQCWQQKWPAVPKSKGTHKLNPWDMPHGLGIFVLLPASSAGTACAISALASWALPDAGFHFRVQVFMPNVPLLAAEIIQD